MKNVQKMQYIFFDEIKKAKFSNIPFVLNLCREWTVNYMYDSINGLANLNFIQ